MSRTNEEVLVKITNSCCLLAKFFANKQGDFVILTANNQGELVIANNQGKLVITNKQGKLVIANKQVELVTANNQGKLVIWRFLLIKLPNLSIKWPK